jgi:hypothetical protein
MKSNALEGKYLSGFVSKLEIMILSHDLECEMGQFHLRVQICKSEAKLVECLTKENVKQIVKLSHIVDNHWLVFSHHSIKNQIFISNFEMANGSHWINIFLLKHSTSWKINTIFEMSVYLIYCGNQCNILCNVVFVSIYLLWKTLLHLLRHCGDGYLIIGLIIQHLFRAVSRISS